MKKTLKVAVMVGLIIVLSLTAMPLTGYDPGNGNNNTSCDHTWSGWRNAGRVIKTCQIRGCGAMLSLDDEMVNIPAGSFERDGHTITLSAFRMSKFQVTQELYQVVMGYNPSYFRGGAGTEPAAGEIQERRPVERVTWFDAVQFCNRLSQREGLTPVYTITRRIPDREYPITSATVTANWSANGYRLPTEAEWEYACRAGTTTTWHFGNNENELVNYAWYEVNSDNRTHQVGLKRSNAWGLYDMHGNLLEWCWDLYGAYPNADQNNPIGAAFGSYRVFRGGGWDGEEEDLHSANRGRHFPNNRNNGKGFRIVRP